MVENHKYVKKYERLQELNELLAAADAIKLETEGTLYYINIRVGK